VLWLLRNRIEAISESKSFG
jgi:hypothetical protein